MAAKKKAATKKAVPIINRNERNQMNRLEAEMGPPVNRVQSPKKKSHVTIWPK